MPLTNSTTGQIAQKVQSYTELEDGLYYLSNGMWAESQDLIEIGANGAQAVRGPLQADFNGDITASGAVILTSPSGEVFKSHPLGLFYSDRSRNFGIFPNQRPDADVRFARVKQ